LILRNNWNSEKNIAKITDPILFIYATRDSMVPQESARKIIDGAIQATAKIEVGMDTENHTSTYLSDPKKYFKAVDNFLKSKYPKASSNLQ